MSKTTEPAESQLPPTRPVLRLVQAPAPETPPADSAKPRSHLGRLMTAFADAIDRDIQLLLDL